jgi:hypothetical protein
MEYVYYYYFIDNEEIVVGLVDGEVVEATVWPSAENMMDDINQSITTWKMISNGHYFKARNPVALVNHLKYLGLNPEKEKRVDTP